MFVAAVALSVAVALVRGGQADRLVSFPFRYLWLMFAAFGVQLVMHLPVFTGLAFVAEAAPYLYPSAYCLLLVCFGFNWRLPGVIWLAGGTLSNLAVIVANGGRMPVDGAALAALGHASLGDSFAAGGSLTNTVLGPETRLPWLGDVFVGTPPFPNPTLFSAGDVLLAIGVFVLVQVTMVTGRRPRKESAVSVGGSQGTGRSTLNGGR